MPRNPAMKIFTLFVVVGIVLMGVSGAGAHQTSLTKEVSSGPAQQAEVKPVITNDTSFTGKIPPYSTSKNDFILHVDKGETVTLTVTNKNSTLPLRIEIGSNGVYFSPTVSSGETITITLAEDRSISPPYKYSITLGTLEQVGHTGPPLETFESSYSVSINFSDSTSSTTVPTTETPAQLPNTLSIRSTGDERVYYNATVSGRIEPGTGADLTGAELPDTVGETTVSGSTAQGGRDNFTYSGEITALDIRGGPATVLVNGEKIDPDSFSSPTPTPTPTATSSPTPTTTPTPTPTPTATPIPSPTATPTATATPTPSPTTIPTPTNVSKMTSTTRFTTRPVSLSTTDAPTASSPASLSPQDTSSSGRLLTKTTDTNSSGESTSFGAGFGVPIAVVIVLVTGFLMSRRVQ